MSRILAFGDRAVMAKHAVIVDVHVVKLPVECRVTVIADIVTGDVPGVFPRGNDAVMAICTATYDRGMIDPGHVRPGVGRMTKIAIADHPYMSARRGAGFNTACVRVTVGTAPGRADEYPLQVTGFACRQGVTEFQRKVGFVVIEFRPEIQCAAAACIAGS